MKKVVAALLAISFLLFSLFSCGGKAASARDQLASLLGLFDDLPAGACYAAVPREGDFMLDPRLTDSLYGRGDGYLEYEGRVSDAAVYLGSGQDPFFEAGVFVCYGSADTRAILEMCMRRGRLVSSVYAVLEGKILLSVNGRTVAYIVASDIEAAQKALDRLF